MSRVGLWPSKLRLAGVSSPRAMSQSQECPLFGSCLFIASMIPSQTKKQNSISVSRTSTLIVKNHETIKEANKKEVTLNAAWSLVFVLSKINGCTSSGCCDFFAHIFSPRRSLSVIIRRCESSFK